MNTGTKTTKRFYEKNPILTDKSINVRYEELLRMTREQFNGWIVHMRAGIVKAWDEFGTPLKSGSTEDEIINSFEQLLNCSTGFRDGLYGRLTRDNELTPNEKDTVIHNQIRLGSRIDSFFPHIMKTAMIYGKKVEGFSVYDLLNDPKFLKKVQHYSWRHYRKDSFRHYSAALKYKTLLDDYGIDLLKLTKLTKMDKLFDVLVDANINLDSPYGFWIEEVKREKTDKNSGYRQVKFTDFVELSSIDMAYLANLAYESNQDSSILFCNIDPSNLDPEKRCVIRRYEKSARIFPKGFMALKLGYISVPVNFPAMTAKYLYERFTKNFINKPEKAIIFDPSCGWGGRILGAMSVDSNRNIHYVGTDPNTLNLYDDGTSRYAAIADFFNTRTSRGFDPFGQGTTHTYDLFVDGSETIRNNPKFQVYKGKVDLVFTSPPYFSKERYSLDDSQSCNKFNNYGAWRDEFLLPTLQTCFDWLKPGGTLLWNIANTRFAGEILPLYDDSKRFCDALGFEYIETLHMTLEGMPGSNRVDTETGAPQCFHYVKAEGKFYKCEPILVVRKPL